MVGGALTFNWIVLLPLGVSLHWTLHMVYGAGRRRQDDYVLMVLSTSGWLLIMAGILGPLFIISGIFSLLLVVVFFLTAIITVARYRDAQRRSLLWALGVAAEREVPLHEAARAFAADRIDEMGRRADRLADLLESGIDLPRAMRESKNPLPIDAELAARLSYKTGHFSAELQETVREGGRHIPAWELLWQRFAYFAVLLVIGLFMATFLMLKIVPTYEVIFADFDMELPVVTRLFIAAAEFTVNYWFLAAPFIWVFGLLFIYAVLYACGWFRWEPPGVAWITRRYHGSVVLRFLAQAVETQQRLDTTLELLARSYPREHVRFRLNRVVAEVAAGNDWCPALRRSGLIGAADEAVLGSAQRVGNLPWALREMSDSAVRRIAYRAGFVLNLAIPVILILIGAGVGVYAVAFFLPMVELVLKWG